MGKRLLVQRRGRGGSVFKSPSWIRIGKVKYSSPTKVEYTSSIKGKVEALLHDPGRGCPVALIRFEDGSKEFIVAPEGLYVGKIIFKGINAPLEKGNILPVGRIPEGTAICNVESRPGDGGKFARSSGSYAMVIAQSTERTIIKMPSGKMKSLDPKCRATIGVVAGGGRIEKPFVKAGTKYHLVKRKAWKWPVVRGKAMVAASHPHGGGHHPKGGTPVPRTAPPGQKVGHIAPRRTGRKKGTPRSKR
ncbi:MAG: 50S ribosomal protein L2 [Candidatus Methanomethylicota archaeon]|nr:MAG: 50S ribosomal protein L2 [Candidatus Verstraetearchaeota archaeon]